MLRNRFDAEKTFVDCLKTSGAVNTSGLDFNRWSDGENSFLGRPDIFSPYLKTVWDVKPDSLYGWSSGAEQIARYTSVSGYSAGTAPSLFGSEESIVLTSSMNRYEYRFVGNGMVIYRALDQSPMERAGARTVPHSVEDVHMKKQTSRPAQPPQGNITGALISDDEARHLSGRLFPLGDQWRDICAELESAGLGFPSKVARSALEALAGTEESRARLHAYWCEWAKEKLAGLNGSRDILRGRYPHVSAYRSDLMESLRTGAANGRLKSEGPIVSPQIEPTLKRYIERLPDDPAAKQLWEEIKEARQQAASALHLAEDPRFAKLSASARYELLIERYRAALEPAGFTLDSHRKTGVVFRKLTSDKRWAFLLADQSKDDVDTGSLSPSFALTLPKKAVVPSVVSLSAVAAFSPDDIVPRFHASCFFANDSYAQFCLAADSIAFLAKTVYARIDKLLAEPSDGVEAPIGRARCQRL